MSVAQKSFWECTYFGLVSNVCFSRHKLHQEFILFTLNPIHQVSHPVLPSFAQSALLPQRAQSFFSLPTLLREETSGHTVLFTNCC